LEKARNGAQGTSAEVAAAKQETETVRSDLNKVRKELEAAKADHDKTRKDTEAGKAKQTEETEKTKKEIEKLKADLSSAESFKSQFETQKKSNEETTKKLDTLQLENKNLQTQIADLNKQASSSTDSKKLLETLQKENSDSKSQITELSKKLEAQSQESATKAATAEQERSISEKKLREIYLATAQQNQSLRQELSALEPIKAENSTLIKQLNEEKETRADLNKRLEEASAKLDKEIQARQQDNSLKVVFTGEKK